MKRPTTTRPAPGTTQYRIAMLLDDLQVLGFNVENLDTATLKGKLGLFDTHTEESMQGGTVVRIVVEEPSKRVDVAKLAATRGFKLILYENR